jgi:type IV fimbrial biogenesis protein FimT
MTARSTGFTLIELMIVLSVMALLLLAALPSMGTWLNNSQLRASADAMQGGLQRARAEALRRNVPVRFQLVDSLGAGCALSATGVNWVISVDDATATGACDAAESETDAPRILQKRSGAEGSTNARINATGPTIATGASSVLFSGLGRVIPPPIGPSPITQIDISNPNGGNCQSDTPAGPMRCLRVNLANGGDVRMCDPAVNPAVDPADPRLCQ